MSTPDLKPSLVEDMRNQGIDVTSWKPEIYDRLKLEMSRPGTSIVYLGQPRDDGAKIGVQRRGVYVKVLGGGSHVLYPKEFKDHKGCQSPTTFVLDSVNDKQVYDHAKRFVRDHFGIEPDPGLVYNWPPGIWPDIRIQEMVEYPIPFTYEAWPVSVELRTEQFDPAQLLASKVDGSEWAWVQRPPKQ
jgi:hypothetical protein